MGIELADPSVAADDLFSCGVEPPRRLTFCRRGGTRGAKRLVLVARKSNRVCGDTAAPGPHTQIWIKITAHLDDDVAGLAASAARLLDQSQGKTARDYIFTTFAADRDSDGYLVFDCTCNDRAPPRLSGREDQEDAFYFVMTSCFYVGYVRRGH